MDRMGELRKEAEKDLETELRELIPLLSAARGIVNHSPSQVIQVNAGGLAVWILALACSVVVAVTLTAVIFVAIGMSDQNNEIQELRQTDQTIQAYINSGLVQPKEEPEQ